MFDPITSPHNPLLKSVIRLKESRFRRKEGLFLVDGIREIQRAYSSSFQLTKVFFDYDVLIGNGSKSRSANQLLEHLHLQGDVGSFLKKLDSQGIPLVPTSSAAFSKIAFGDRNEGLVAVVRARTMSLETLSSFFAKKLSESSETPLLGVLEGVEKPGNVGAILRSADGAGIDALLIAADDYDVFNPNAIRASLGAIFHIPVVVAPATKILEWLRENLFQRVTALCDESVSYLQPDYRRPTAIILGSEAYGLSTVWSRTTEIDNREALLTKIRLPMLGVADSLNVSNAAAILFYEARRVRSTSEDR